jgi:hypothetical protein
VGDGDFTVGVRTGQLIVGPFDIHPKGESPEDGHTNRKNNGAFEKVIHAASRRRLPDLVGYCVRGIVASKTLDAQGKRQKKLDFFSPS